MPIGNIYEPPWMRDDPFARGAQTGIALGNAYLSAQAQKQAIAQRAAMFPLQLKQLQQQSEAFDAELPLKLKSLELANEGQITQNALGVTRQQVLVDAQKLSLKREQSMSELARTMGAITAGDNWGTLTADTFISGLATRAPWLMDTPEWKAVEKMQSDAKVARAKKESDEAHLATQRAIWGQRTETQIETATIRAGAAEEVARIKAEASSQMRSHPGALTLEGRMLLKEFDAETEALGYGAKYLERFEAIRKKYEDRLNSLSTKESQAVAQPKKVRVISPDGRTGWVPQEQLESALRQGYRRAD